MILADDNFATIVAAVREGRGDLRQHPQVPALPALVEHRRGADDVPRRRARRRDRSRRHRRGDGVPLLATQILWINLLTDGAPALALGVDPPPDDVMQRPPRRLTDRVIDARDVARHLLGRPRDGGRHARRARSAPRRRPARRLGRHRRGAHDGVHDARARPALQLLQRPLGSHERLPPPLHEPAAVGRDRALGRAPGRGRAAPVPQRRVRNDAARARPTGSSVSALASIVLWADEAKKLVERWLRR